MNILAIKGKTTYIGHEGDALGTVVQIPAQRVIDEFGSGTFLVLVRRPGESESYPAENVEEIDGTVLWTVSAVDAGKTGAGEIQVVYTNGTTVLHSQIYAIDIKASLDGSADMPEAYDPYLTEIIKQAQRARTAAEEALTAQDDAEQFADEANESAIKAEDLAAAARAEAEKAISYMREAAKSAEAAKKSEDAAEELALEAVRSSSAAAFSAGYSEEMANKSATSAGESKAALQELKDGIARGDFKGEKGNKGDRGEKGDTGSQGPAGADGKDWIPTAEELESIADQAAEKTQPAVSELKEDLTLLDGRVETLEREPKVPEDLVQKVDDTADRLDALYKLTEGQVWDVVETETEGMADKPKGTFTYSVEEVYGKTEQESTNGYQLLDFPNLPFYRESGDVSFEKAGNGFRVSSRGVTGKILVSAPFEQGTYTLSFDITEKVTSEQINIGWLGCGLYKSGINATGHYSVGLATNGNGTFFSIYVGASDTVTVNNIMLEKGSTAHPYEPFTNGPSPNPDFPQKIESIQEIHIDRINGKHSYLVTDDQWLWLKNNEDKWHYKGCCIWLRSDLGRIFIINKDSVLSGSNYNNMININPDGTSRETNNNGINLNNSSYVYLYADGTFYVASHSKYMEMKYDSETTINLPSDATQRITEQRTIIPPRPLNAIGDYRDVADVDEGVWKYVIKDTDIVSMNVISRSNYWNGLCTVARTDLPNDFDGSKLLSNMFVYTSKYLATINAVYADGNNLIFNVTNFADGLNVMRNWFNENNPKILYSMKQTITEPISEYDLAFLRSLEKIPSSDNLFITDQNGRDVSYLLEVVRKLSEVVA